MTYAYGLTTECYEMNGSPVEEATDTSFTATVKLRCPWSDRNSLSAELSNYTAYQSGVVQARARSIGIVPFTAVQGAGPSLQADYEDAIVTIQYVFDKDTPSESDGVLFSESLEPTAQNLTMQWESFIWKTSQIPILQGEQPGKILRGMDYVLTKYNLAAIPSAALTLVGCCNLAAMTASTLGLTFAAQTLLFNPPSLQRKVSLGPSPENKWTATYRLTYKPEGWNKFWNSRVNPPAWDMMQVWTGAAWIDYTHYPPASFAGI